MISYSEPSVLLQCTAIINLIVIEGFDSDNSNDFAQQF